MPLTPPRRPPRARALPVGTAVPAVGGEVTRGKGARGAGAGAGAAETPADATGT
ncbi:hypothetical protein [Streptomyces syringium]|uniref:hypothetical protein n=1 Tax=Streptomyces syringium TaxID=76729 RepID=UPI0033D7FF63